LLGAGHGFFVREDIPLAEPLQADPGHETAPGVSLPPILENLML
jgi:hypothetical protein